MLLEGSIRRFNLASVLQFLAQAEASGVVEVRDFDEFGFVYLVGGHVEAISLPVTDEKLGNRLVRAGALTDQQLAEALMEEATMTHEEKKAKPLGQRLIDKGWTNAQTVQEVMARQLTDQVFALAQWQNGVFLYDEPERMPDFRVSIQANVQQLLLDAYRRIDEGEVARVQKTVVDNEVCFACPLEPRCDDVIKTKYLKRDVCLWRKMGAVIDDAYEQVQDSRKLYKSRDTVEKTDLETTHREQKTDFGSTLDAET